MTATTEPAVDILVVDDVPQNLLAMQALLARPGLRVLTAPSGAQALELLLEHEVALALLDVQMPEMDGFALAELMRGAQRTREVPIIFLTASPTDPRRSFRGYEAGAVDFLHKPLDPTVITSKVDVFVQLFRQRRALHERNEALERLLKLNETMAAVLTHDLRSPLSAIMTSAELLRRLAPNDAQRTTAERIKTSGQRMSRMITQLLDFSRIRSGALQLQRQPAELDAVCRTVVAELQQAHPRARIELSAQGDLHAEFDADRLQQVFSNLIGNALQHGREGTPVLVALDGTDATTLRASVFNAGHVPDELLPRLFDPFKHTPGDPAGHGGSGLGLGLYIVAQFLQAHGGGVSARNTPEGVLVELTLPRRLD
jgi:signal transduction histidine kinase